MGIIKFLKNLWNPEPINYKSVVTFDEMEIVCCEPDGEKSAVQWKDLCKVIIRTTSEGPYVDDIFWILVGKNSVCIVPSESNGAHELIKKLWQLPSFDFQEATNAMCCTSDKEFLCWQCKEPEETT